MLDRGWRVVRVDIDPRFRPDLCADVRDISPTGLLAMLGGDSHDLVWASPPCQEFARLTKPPLWRNGPPPPPDLSLVEATVRLVRDLKPRFWVIENVRGAVGPLRPLLGPPRQRCGSWYLWGDFPFFLCPPLRKGCGKSVHPDTGKRHRAPHLRALVPYQLGWALAEAIEAALCHCAEESCG